MRIAVKFAYDGRSFSGYARQPKLKTVEGELIKTIKQRNNETPKQSKPKIDVPKFTAGEH